MSSWLALFPVLTPGHLWCLREETVTDMETDGLCPSHSAFTLPRSLPLNAEDCWPKDMGIVALEIYFSSQYADHAELEKYNGIDAGKYTTGLGQARVGFHTDREDITSLCMTVV